MDRCLYDPFDQCFHDCPNCARGCCSDRYDSADNSRDVDLERDSYNERED